MLFYTVIDDMTGEEYAACRDYDDALDAASWCEHRGRHVIIRTEELVFDD